MVSTIRSGETTVGSYATVAAPVMRFTFAVATPGVRSSVRCTRPLHAAQVIPVTGMVQDSVGGVSVSDIVSLGVLRDDAAAQHAHAARELVGPLAGREAHRSGSMGRQIGANPEVGNDDLLRARVGLVAVELELNRHTGPDPNDRRGRTPPFTSTRTRCTPFAPTVAPPTTPRPARKKYQLTHTTPGEAER